MDEREGGMKTEGQVTIVQVDEGSASDAARFFHAELDDTFTRTFPQEAVEKYRKDQSEENLRDAALDEGRVLLAAKEGDEIIGLMVGSALNGGVASVVWLTVGEQARGKGVGRLLMERTFEAYERLGAHKVVVYTETEEGRRFYERVGMDLEGTHPRHWWGVTHHCLGRVLKTGGGA